MHTHIHHVVVATQLTCSVDDDGGKGQVRGGEEGDKGDGPGARSLHRQRTGHTAAKSVNEYTVTCVCVREREKETVCVCV